MSMQVSFELKEREVYDLLDNGELVVYLEDIIVHMVLKKE